METVNPDGRNLLASSFINRFSAVLSSERTSSKSIFTPLKSLYRSNRSILLINFFLRMDYSKYDVLIDDQIPLHLGW